VDTAGIEPSINDWLAGGQLTGVAAKFGIQAAEGGIPNSSLASVAARSGQSGGVKTY
jgi:hypothetical protein